MRSPQEGLTFAPAPRPVPTPTQGLLLAPCKKEPFAFASPGLDSDFLAVLSDYPPPDISPPIFRRGEKLRVISE